MSKLLGAYDHIISTHDFCRITANDDHIDEQKEEKKSDTASTNGNYEANPVRQYVINEIGGYCKLEDCQILQKHILRRRETNDDKNDNNNDKNINTDDDNTVQEILNATFNALHCYILHSKKELYRLLRENNNSHFITSFIDHEPDINEAKNDDVHEEKSILNLNFGTSVLNWFPYQQEPPFTSFRHAIVQNDESTITDKLYLNFSQECFVKLNNRKYEQYTLDELLSLKIYTDTNEYQSALRKSHWRSSSIQMKQSFYYWSLQLYKTSLFHAKPTPRWKVESKAPCKIYHGLNQVFTLDNARPIYNGPVSTSLDESVAHSFSETTGLIWTIAPSYSNKFKFVKGICVDWISQHKNESEVLLVNQCVPITSTRNFENDINNNVDHLLYTLK
eukprot:486914_1